MFAELNRTIALSADWKAEFVFLYEIRMGINGWGLILHGPNGAKFDYFKGHTIAYDRGAEKQPDEDLTQMLSRSDCGRYLKVKTRVDGDWVVDLIAFRLAPIRIEIPFGYGEDGQTWPIWEQPIYGQSALPISFEDRQPVLVTFGFTPPDKVTDELTAYKKIRLRQVEELLGSEHLTPDQRRFACGCFALILMLIIAAILQFIWGFVRNL